MKRLRNAPYFRLDCEYLHSDTVPSEVSHSRMIELISESNELARVHDELLLLAIGEGNISEKNIAIDATHFEMQDRSWPSEKKEKTCV